MRRWSGVLCTCSRSGCRTERGSTARASRLTSTRSRKKTERSSAGWRIRASHGRFECIAGVVAGLNPATPWEGAGRTDQDRRTYPATTPHRRSRLIRPESAVETANPWSGRIKMSAVGTRDTRVAAPRSKRRTERLTIVGTQLAILVALLCFWEFAVTEANLPYFSRPSLVAARLFDLLSHPDI